MIMDNSMEQFVVLLSTAIRGQRLETYCYTDNIDYSKIFRFAAYHKVDSLIYSILKTNDILDNELLSAWKRNAIVSNLYEDNRKVAGNFAERQI